MPQRGLWCRRSKNFHESWSRRRHKLWSGGERMKRKRQEPPELRLEPDKRLCPKFDETGIARFPVARREEMGVRVVDDCAEEHIM